MVRATKVGKPRSFGRGLLLTIVTFGIYSIYWNYKAHSELYKQFDLEDEGRNEGVVWLILGVVFGLLMYVYQWIFVSNVNHLQDRLGIRKRVTPLGFILLEAVPGVLVIMGYIAMVIGLAGTPVEDADLSGEIGGAVAIGLGLVVVGAIAALVGAMIAYAKLQHSINDVWSAYDARMAALRAPPPPPTSLPPSEGPTPSGLPAWAAGTGSPNPRPPPPPPPKSAS